MRYNLFLIQLALVVFVHYCLCNHISLCKILSKSNGQREENL